MINALGLLEVDGMVAAIDAADAMPCSKQLTFVCSVTKCLTLVA